MVQSTEEFRALVKAARRAGTPLLAIRTADPASAMAIISECVCAKPETPVFAVQAQRSGRSARSPNRDEP